MATPGAQKYRKAFTMTLETREVWGPSQAVAPQGGVGLPEETQRQRTTHEACRVTPHL